VNKVAQALDKVAQAVNREAQSVNKVAQAVNREAQAVIKVAQAVKCTDMYLQSTELEPRPRQLLRLLYLNLCGIYPSESSLLIALKMQNLQNLFSK
jgi:hypothetical protein